MIISDIRFNIFFKIQNYINYSLFFLHHLNELQKQWITTIIYSLTNNQQLILENKTLQKKLFTINSELLLIEHYKKENNELRKLLFSPDFRHEKKILTQIVASKINSYTSQVIINKGKNHGVHIGQAVINEKGIIGQIISTNKLTSQVLLICDRSHALPVQILRNNTRMILKGKGYHKNLELKNFPHTNDIKIGDVLITSGLDGRFPKGYPVATISSITNNKKTAIKKIQASPIAKLNHLSYLLLLENTENNIAICTPTNIMYKKFNND